MQILKPKRSVLLFSLFALTWAGSLLAEPPMLISLLEPTPFVPDPSGTGSDNPFSESQRDQLSSIVQSLHKGRYADAKRMIARVRVQYLSRTDEALLSIYKAFIAIHEQRFSDALRDTNRVASPDLLPDNYRVQWHDLRATAFDGLHQHLESVRERIWLEHLLVDAKRLKKNRLLIWQSLLQITPDTLDLLNPDSPPDILSGWISLALLYQNAHGYIEGDSQGLKHWRADYPLHPARAFLANLSEVEAELKGPSVQPQRSSRRETSITSVRSHSPKQVAVLLPMKGQHVPLSKAIQKGLLTAFYDNATRDGTGHTQLRFYDSSDTKSLAKLYREIRATGTDFIIGPLKKNTVTQLTNINHANIPMLALNDNERFHEGNTLFFSLNPEAEAQEVAEQLWDEGVQRIAVLAIDSAWGRRLEKAFQHRWESLGGNTLGRANIKPGKDLSDNIANLLNVKKSQRRFQQFRRLIPEKVHFEPRIRQDIQAVVIFATPELAKQIRPLLKFHFAGHLPLYATSHIYSQIGNSAQEDLNAIQYCDIPLILQPTQQQGQLLQIVKPHLNSSHLRLFALGYDSFQIMLNFQAFRSNPGLQLPGMTGILALNDTNRITRQLTWAKFQNGYPKPLGRPYRP